MLSSFVDDYIRIGGYSIAETFEQQREIDTHGTTRARCADRARVSISSLREKQKRVVVVVRAHVRVLLLCFQARARAG